MLTKHTTFKKKTKGCFTLLPKVQRPSISTNYGRFTLGTMKLSHGNLRASIGCYTRPTTTSVYTREKIGRVTMEVEVPKI